MRPSNLWLFLSAISFLLCASSAHSWERTFNFEEDELNSPPKGIVIETPPPSRPLVVVQKEENVDSPNKILALSGSRFPGVNFFSAIVYFSNILDGKVSIRFKHSGEKETIRTIGLLWRKTENATYSFECDTTKSTLSLLKIIAGKRAVLEKEKLVIPAGEWLKLEVEFKDDQIHGFLNNQEVIKGKSDAIMEPGKAGFFVQSNTIILADDFKIQGDEVK